LNLKRTQNKLLKNGFLPEIQTPTFEKWIDAQQNGTPISFYVEGEKVKTSLKIHGRKPDQIEFDEHYSDYTRNVSDAITLSRV
jgi:hypothetical protein